MLPSKEEADNISNMGTPYDVVCASFEVGCGPSKTTSVFKATGLKTASFSIATKSCAHIWVRAEKTHESSKTPMHDVKVLSTNSVSDNPSSTLTYRKHLSSSACSFSNERAS